MVTGLSVFGLFSCPALFGAEGGEKDHFLDGELVAHQHREPIDSDAQAGSGRHAVFYGPEEILVEGHCFLVAPGRQFELVLEAGPLVDGGR